MQQEALEPGLAQVIRKVKQDLTRDGRLQVRDGHGMRAHRARVIDDGPRARVIGDGQVGGRLPLPPCSGEARVPRCLGAHLHLGTCTYLGRY